MLESLKQVYNALKSLWGSKFTFLPTKKTIILCFSDVCSETIILLWMPTNLIKVHRGIVVMRKWNGVRIVSFI